MVDEIVDGVLKKGYLTKKGHKVKNYKRRWFVLQRTILRYYTSREKLTLKVCVYMCVSVCVCVCVQLLECLLSF